MKNRIENKPEQEQGDNKLKHKNMTGSSKNKVHIINYLVP